MQHIKDKYTKTAVRNRLHKNLDQA